MINFASYRKSAETVDYGRLMFNRAAWNYESLLKGLRLFKVSLSDRLHKAIKNPRCMVLARASKSALPFSGNTFKASGLSAHFKQNPPTDSTHEQGTGGSGNQRMKGEREVSLVLMAALNRSTQQ